MKLNPKRRHFENIEEIQAESQGVMKMLTQNDFHQYFRSWKSCWDSCNAEGNYFEGDGSGYKFRKVVKLRQTNFGNFWVASHTLTLSLPTKVHAMRVLRVHTMLT
jgi:hypothetical protein